MRWHIVSKPENLESFEILIECTKFDYSGEVSSQERFPTHIQMPKNNPELTIKNYSC